jgi:hypothetical protein
VLLLLLLMMMIMIMIMNVVGRHFEGSNCGPL